MERIYSEEDAAKLEELESKLKEYDSYLFARLNNKLEKRLRHSPNMRKCGYQFENDIKIAFLNDVGRQSIIDEIQKFYMTTYPQSFVVTQK